MAKKKGKKKDVWFIEVVGDTSATKSKAAKESMELLKKKIEEIKKKPKQLL